MHLPKTHPFLFLTLVLMMPLLVACGSEPYPPEPSPDPRYPTPVRGIFQRTLAATTPLAQVATVTSRCLKGKPCKSPCFEGITIPQTTGFEALKLLEQNTSVRAAQLKYSYDAQELTRVKGEVQWYWTTNKRVSDLLSQGKQELIFYDKAMEKDNLFFDGVISFDANNQKSTVFKIATTLENFSFEDIVAASGEPESIVVDRVIPDYAENNKLKISFNIYLFYINSGFVVKATNLSEQEIPATADKLQFKEVVFFPSGLKPGELYQNHSLFPATFTKQAKKWEGNKPLSYYCTTVLPVTDVRDCYLRPLN